MCKEKKLNILFFGLGRIGLPQSLVFASKNINVYGFDVDRTVIDLLNEGKTCFYEPMMEEYLKEHLHKTFHPIDNWHEIIHEIDYILFTLGTQVPDSESCLIDEKLDLSLIENTLSEIFNSGFKKGVNLIFRTTLPVGSIDNFKSFIEKKFNLQESKDFFVSFVPERLVEGNAVGEEENLPKIIGSYSEESFLNVEKLFKKIGGKIIKVENPKTAEFCKLTDNTYRNTMFAYANDLAMISAEAGVDIQNVLEAVNSDYDRNRIPKPGFVSGYCLGKDPYILEYSVDKEFSENRGFHSLWYYGRRINDYLYDYIVEKIIKKIGKDNISNKTIGILGLSFKEDIDDFRMSHAFNILDKLIEAGATKFKLYDPNLNQNKYTQIEEKYLEFVEDATDSIDCNFFDNLNVLIVAHMHNEIKQLNDIKVLEKLIKNNLIVFDGWNVLRELIKLDNVNYQSIGLESKI